MPANTYVRVAGAWKKINKAYVRVGGAWKKINKAYVRVGGVWKLVHQGVTPPSVTPGSVTYSTAGSFNFTVPLHNMLQVELWGGGGAGNNRNSGGGYGAGGPGGASTWNGGSAYGKPQANGGLGAGTTPSNSFQAPGGLGGTAAGDLALPQATESLSGSQGGGGKERGGDGSGGASPYGGATCPRASVTGAGLDGNVPGGGGSAFLYSSKWGAGGGGGGFCRQFYAAGFYAPSGVVPLVVGAAGPNNATSGPYSGGNGAVGRVRISWS